MASVEHALDWISRALDVPVVWVRAGLLVAAALILAIAWHLLVRHVLIPLARRTSAEVDDVVLDNVDAPGAATIAFLGALGAARLLWAGVEHTTLFRRLLVTGVLVIWGAALAKAITVVLRRGTRRLIGAHQQSAVNLLARLVKVAVGIVIVLTLFSVWQVNVTPVVASAGLIGIALALAAQDTLANFFSGVAIYMDQPYQIGDWIVLDQGSEGEVRGIVRDVGLRSTRLLTRGDVLISIPNSVMASGRITNESGHVPQYRVAIRVGVAYDSDLEHVERVLERAADAHPLVIGEPAPRVRVRQFGESSIDMDLLVWIRNPEHRAQVVHELCKRVHKAFREEGITIPFPQRDVHLDPAAR